MKLSKNPGTFCLLASYLKEVSLKVRHFLVVFFSPTHLNEIIIMKSTLFYFSYSDQRRLCIVIMFTQAHQFVCNSRCWKGYPNISRENVIFTVYACMPLIRIFSLMNGRSGGI